MHENALKMQGVKPCEIRKICCSPVSAFWISGTDDVATNIKIESGAILPNMGYLVKFFLAPLPFYSFFLLIIKYLGPIVGDKNQGFI